MGSAPPRAISSEHFPKLGIKLSKIRELIAQGGDIGKFVGLTTQEVCDNFVKPMTTRWQTSVCEILRAEKHPAVGTAQVFISHAWKFKFLEVIDALEQHFLKTPDIIVWFDLFSNNQHNTQSRGFDWWCTTFKTAISDFGHVVMVLNPWYDPIPLTRGWCLFELYCSTADHVKFEIAMTREQRSQCLEALVSNPKAGIAKLIARIDCERSETFDPKDKEQIFDVIRRTVGFPTLNAMVFHQIWQWATNTIYREIQRETDELHRTKLTVALASVYREHGDRLNAEKLFEKCLEVRKRLLGEDHEDTVAIMHELVAIHLNYTTLSALRGINKKTDLYREKQALLQQKRSNLGETHPDTLSALRDFGNYCKSSFRYEEAEEALVEALAMAARIQVQSHLHLTAMSDLARLYYDQGQYAKAKPLFLRVIQADGVHQSLGLDNPVLIADINKVAFIYCEEDNIVDAENLYSMMIQQSSLILGANHPTTLQFWLHFAMFYMGIRQFDEAAKILKRLLQRWTETLGAEHETTIQVQFTLANCLQQQHRQPAISSSATATSSSGLAVGQREAGRVLPKKFVWYYTGDINEPRVWYVNREGSWIERYPDGGEGICLANQFITIPPDQYSGGHSVRGLELRRSIDNGQRLFIPFVGEPVMWFRFKQPNSNDWLYLGEMKNIEC